MNTEHETNTTENEKPETSGETLNQETELAALRSQLEEQKNRYLYLYAEFENYKKRALKERSDLLKFGHESLVREVLQVGDNLSRALEHTSNQEALVSGLKMVQKQLQETLTRFGVTQLTSLGAKFDPEFHEAVGQEVSAEQPEGHVVRELQPGFTLHGRLVRPARVVVALKQK